MRVGYDSDGVIDNFGEGVRETLVAANQGHLWKSGPTKAPFWNFYEDWGWTFEQFKELVDWGVDEGIIFSGHWRDNAIDSMHRVKSLGHEIIIITDRSWGSDPKNSERNTRLAFERAGVPFDELHFNRDKTIVQTDTFVEDKIENYDALLENGTVTWLINRPWNQVPGGDARRRINCVSEYADAIELATRNGFTDLSFA